MSRKITFVHLFNDFSGSPLILSTVVKGMLKKGFECEVITCADQEGFLSNIDGCQYNYFNYRWHPNRYLRLLLYLWSQLILIFKIYNKRNDSSIIYINTMLPFGAAIGGKIVGKRVVYHIHEVSIKPLLLKRFLKWIAERFSDQIIFVSKFLAQEGRLKKVESATVYNALSENFIEDAELQKLVYKKPNATFTVLMLCSLKDYKGLKEFVDIADKSAHTNFELVINADQASINNYFKSIDLPENLKIYPKQTNVHPFYSKADLIVNLSHPEQWVETFGMTLLEGMYYGLPCIAPPVGGPAEIVEHNKDGYLIDQRHIQKLVECIHSLQQNPELYQSISKNAKLKASKFRYDKMINEIHDLL